MCAVRKTRACMQGSEYMRAAKRNQKRRRFVTDFMNYRLENYPRIVSGCVQTHGGRALQK
jgi:hypothetical protein